MAQITTVELAKKEMFTSADELRQKYPEERVRHLVRLRAMYDWMLANPAVRDRVFIDHFKAAYGLSVSCLYADLALTKELLPALNAASREFHRHRVSDMLLESYNMAKARKDVKSMVAAAAQYGKLNRVDLEDEKKLPFDLIVYQPFTPTFDPTVLGIKPIPNADEVKAQLKKRLAADIPDIEDVEYEPADLEEETLFPSDNG